MQAQYLDRDGRPVTGERWRQLSRQPGYSRVACAATVQYGREVTMATFWLRIAGGAPGAPLIFRSYGEIRRPADRRASYRRMWGWPSLEAAQAGHQAVTAWLAQVTAWLAGETSQRPGPPPSGLSPESRPRQVRDGERL